MRLFKSKSDSEDIYDEFYASIKLISGEELLCMVIVDKTNEDHIIIDNPVICNEIRSSGTNVPAGYKFEPWMKMTDEDSFMLSTSSILTISEVKNEEIIETYRYIIETGFNQSHPDITKEMGYLSSVDSARETLEKLYKLKDTKDS